MPRVSTSSTRLASLGGESEAGEGGRDGRDHLPASADPAARSRRTPPRAPALPARRAPAPRTSRTPDERVRQRGDLDAPDRSAVQRAGEPVDVVGVEVGQHHAAGPGRRPADAGSGPSAAGRGRCRRPPRVPAPALSTSPSPWPTSQATITQPRGGHPGVGQRHQQHARPSPTRAPAAWPDGPAPRRGTGRPRTQTTVSTAMPTGPGRPADGRHRKVAPCTATAMIHEAHQAAGAATSRPERGGDQPDHSAGQAEHRGRARRRAPPAGWRRPPPGVTWPEMAATSGVQAICAASGTATASATQRGSQRAQPVAPARREPEDAGGGQGREGEPGRHRQPRVDQQQEQHGGAQRPGTAATPVVPMPTSATEPIAAARSTLGSVRASSTKPDARRAPRPRPGPGRGRPTQRASRSREPTTSVRLVPETASRWVSPEVRKASISSSGIRASSPSTSAGTRARGPRALARDRRPDRVPQAVGARGAAGRAGASDLRRPARAEHPGQVAGAGLLQPPAHAQPSSRASRSASARRR